MLLEAVLGSRTKVRVLSALAREDYPSLSRLAEDCARSKRVVYAAVLELERLGVVYIGRGRRWAISLVSGHPLAPLLQEAVRLDERMSAERVAAELPKEGVERIVWFGSTQRGEGTPRSDLDVLVVTARERYEALKALIGPAKELGRSMHRGIHLEVSSLERPGRLEPIARGGEVIFPR